MPLDYATVKDWRFDEVRQRYDQKDTMLYALGIGLGQDPEDTRQLRYVYEEGLQAFPTMGVVLAYPGFWVRDPRTGIDWVKVVHGEQRLTVHAPLPASGMVVSRTRNTHVIDKGADKGAIVINERTLHGEDGACLATLRQSTFCRGDGGFGQGDASPEPLPPTPDSEPDLRCELRVAPNAALLYRLNADPNPLHVDPEVARQAGYPRPILHGLCSYGVAAHAIVKSCCDYDASRLTSLNTRFSAPVYPGETLQCDIWRQPDGQIQFLARSRERDVVVMSHGTATVQS
ncbi:MULTISPECIES: MaoC/PaaZ C-terminal domain-containing protein [Achromobacter]|uniref:3-alpha,7-alpha, 12-alpha-trihydroxy-5-beta-cholest-24-enoyl-CoA hydratase n=1 Tax=Achromobacter spanius TaxID=217203 RepID=A0AAW3I397_9BURK|nr:MULTISPECIES: MaoC/PaaZ C-terminal domain-containing protein [Achromobacter]KNE27012.1 3-alpha,7-alpha,12-alpha-trihydroxy-5-beta-cholest-24-enoyl-CoA hydratase [Achromobacter spanius]MCD0495273.1 MaoC family dehydratase N-terminal domain-containing protein [Achromobacter sp. MY14]MCW3155272.1 MaoC/PaaZ C-terminal domain-containing protein [Achromobacter spanius]